MAKINFTPSRHKRRKKVLKMAKGYFGSKSILYKTAHEQVMRSLQYAYRSRKQRKRDFRKLWISRINAGSMLCDMKYSRFMHGLTLAKVDVNRKVLADLACQQPEIFANYVKLAREALYNFQQELTLSQKEYKEKEKKVVKAQVINENNTNKKIEPTNSNVQKVKQEPISLSLLQKEEFKKQQQKEKEEEIFEQEQEYTVKNLVNDNNINKKIEPIENNTQKIKENGQQKKKQVKTSRIIIKELEKKQQTQINQLIEKTITLKSSNTQKATYPINELTSISSLNLAKMLLPDLKKLAKEHQIPQAYKLKKAEIIGILKEIFVKYNYLKKSF